MPEPILCKICGRRRPKRACPAVYGDICALCCGNERENTLTCPLECAYLQEAHRHEKPLDIPERDLANTDIPVSESFVTEHEELVLFCVYALLQAALRTAGAVDTDLLAALEALVKTHRTLESGLMYETISENAIAAAIQRSFSASLDDYQKLREEREALSPVRNSDVLKTLAFLHRVGQQNQNGRPRGRLFIDLLHHMTPDKPVDERAPSIILT
ncbi:MAG: hypothetical protein JO061_00940 [Acidobacteriaceae bacterium]|nr:hypothetical protein [Acidobacteriaceae bacterium]